MKEYVVVYNLNSRGKKLTESYLTTLFEKHNLKSKIFMTSNAVSYTHLRAHET